MSFISLIIVKCALKHTGVVAKKSNLIAPLPPLMPHHSGRQWKMAAISVNLDLCGEKENFLFRKMFRSLVCPPAFGPAKRSQNFGPFRTAFPHFRRFAFRVSLSQFRDAQVTTCNVMSVCDWLCIRIQNSLLDVARVADVVLSSWWNESKWAKQIVANLCLFLWFQIPNWTSYLM
jgi:hypothetical protein